MEDTCCHMGGHVHSSEHEAPRGMALMTDIKHEVVEGVHDIWQS